MSVDMNVNRRGVLEVKVTGKLDREDYEYLAPRVEEMIEAQGKLNLLLDMHDFHGWTAGALWEDVKFDLKHFDDVGRLAMVGETKWQEGMSHFCKPFTTAKVRYFERGDEARAREWVAADAA